MNNKNKTFLVLECLFSIIVSVFVVSSLKIIQECQSVKLFLDLFRVFVFILIVFFAFKKFIKINHFVFLFCCTSLPYIFFKSDIFSAQLIMGLCLSFLVYKLGAEIILLKALIVSLFLISLVIILVETGILETTIGVNHLASQSDYIVENKNDWAFWHPNVVSFLIVSCVVVSFYFSKMRLLLISFVLYSIILSETVSRTFLIVPFFVVLFLVLNAFKLSRKKIVVAVAFLFSISSIFLSLFFVFPELVSFLFGNDFFIKADIVLSYRLSIAESAFNPLSFFELASGFHGKNIEVDSFFINLVLAQGLWVYFFVLALLSRACFVAFKKRMSKDLLVLSLFLLLSNFENIAGMSSLFFMVACISMFNIFFSHNSLLNGDINKTPRYM